MEKTKTIGVLLLLLCGMTAHALDTQASDIPAGEIIARVIYQGNQVTHVSVLNRERYLMEGEVFDDVLAKKSQQAIMDLGLFTSVYYYTKPHNESEGDSDGVSRIDVVFVVEEKYYLLVIPKLKIEDDEYFFGLQLKWDNAFGLNHEARIQSENRGSTRGVDESRHLFRYAYPNIFASTYSVGVSARTENNVDESDGAVNRQDDRYQITVLTWFNEKGRNRGWFAGARVVYQKRINEDLIADVNSQNIDAIILGVDIGYESINEYKYNRQGWAYGYQFDIAHESIGSEAEFTQHRFYYRRYYRLKKHNLKERAAANVNYQIRFAHANNLILGDDAFSLGGGNDLRGYERDRFNGNTLFVGNVEYLQPHPSHPLLRYVVFIDAGNTYARLRDVFHEALNVGAGVGIRWKFRSFVDLDLRMDVGYGFADKDYRFSFGTRHVF